MGSDQMLEQAPIARIRYAWRVTPVLLGRNARLWIRFRVSMVVDLVASAAQASVFFFLGSALGTSGTQSWGQRYAGFLVIGVVFNAVLQASLTGPYQSLSTDYWFGRLETIL